MKLLFVDDDPLLLRAFQRGITARRGAWHARFAAGGDEALAMLRDEDADVVISDIAMPGMNGFALLEHVRMRFPRTTRVVLSGNVETFQDARSCAVVHQWLAKPCSMTRLCAAIDQLAWARGILEPPLLERALAIADLPIGATTPARVAEATTHGELATAVAADPGLAAKVLKLASSGLFGGEDVTTIAAAVTTVGTEHVRAIAAACAPVADDGPRQHARAVAELAAELVVPELAEIARTAGLLHGIGQLVERELPPPVAARFGGTLLATWQLPMAIARGVAYHSDASASDVIASAVAAAQLRLVQRP